VEGRHRRPVIVGSANVELGGHLVIRKPALAEDPDRFDAVAKRASCRGYCRLPSTCPVKWGRGTLPTIVPPVAPVAIPLGRAPTGVMTCPR